MSGAGYIGSLAGPEYVSKVNRVLDAARAWRNLHGDNLKGKWVSAQELSDALDALDMPRERYTVQQHEFSWLIRRDGIVYVHLGGNTRIDTAAEIAAALNAAERYVVSQPGESRDAFEKRLKS